MRDQSGHWRGHARRAIDEALARAQEVGADRARTIQLIDAAYPFGERSHYPYKAWLQERKHSIAILDGWVPVPEVEAWMERHGVK